MRPTAVAIAALAFAFAWPIQVTGYNQNAHYAFTKALAQGVPYVDGTIREVGDLASGDVASFEGHLYAVKGPGLALVSVPALAAAEALGMRTTGDPMRALWVLHLIGSVLPALVLLLLVRSLADRLQPGFATITAVTLGAATLILPFATLYFAHVLSATLGFAAFTLLWWEREQQYEPFLLAGAGLLAGFAIVTEPQLALLAAVVGLYALRRKRLVRRVLLYGGGVVVGVLPLLAFNRWAFGSPFHTPYRDYWSAETGGGEPGLFRYFGPSAGDLGNAWEFLFSALGLVVLTPVIVAGVAGLLPMWRRGFRAETLALAGVIVVYVAYNTGNRGFGGLGPPRYLLTLVPFAMLPVAYAFRAAPLATSALALVSALQMTLMTATGPLAAYDGDWLHRVGERDFVQTAASLVDITGWYTILPFLLAVGVAVGAAARATRWPSFSLEDAGLAAVALAGWALLALRASNSHGHPPGTGYVLALAAVLALGALLVTLLGGRGSVADTTPVRSL